MGQKFLQLLSLHFVFLVIFVLHEDIFLASLCCWYVQADQKWRQYSFPFQALMTHEYAEEHVVLFLDLMYVWNNPFRLYYIHIYSFILSFVILNIMYYSHFYIQ